MISLLLFLESQNLNRIKMNKRDFLKSAAALAGATALTPLASASSKANDASRSFSGITSAARDINVKATDKVVLKKALGLGMITEDLSLTDKFKLAKDIGFDGVELNSPVDFSMKEIMEAKEKRVLKRLLLLIKIIGALLFLILTLRLERNALSLLQSLWRRLKNLEVILFWWYRGWLMTRFHMKMHI